VRQLGRRIGNWLTRDQAQQLLCAVDRNTLRGKRDAAVMGLLLGSLRMDQLQLRESHCVIVDLTGKGGRVRTVPVSGWCKELLDRWITASAV